MNKSYTFAHQIVEKLRLADLPQERPSPWHSNRTHTVSWALLHALEHAALHAGHAQITRQLWDTR